MPTVTGQYLGDLRVECVHVASGTTIITDAPVDNYGKGEAFSPTDLCATALGTCALTIMAMLEKSHGIDLKGTTVEINKFMGAAPRRIARIEVVYTMPKRSYNDADKFAIENAAAGCPMCLSLHPETEQSVKFIWS